MKIYQHADVRLLQVGNDLTHHSQISHVVNAALWFDRVPQHAESHKVEAPQAQIRDILRVQRRRWIECTQRRMKRWQFEHGVDATLRKRQQKKRSGTRRTRETTAHSPVIDSHTSFFVDEHIRVWVDADQTKHTRRQREDKCNNKRHRTTNGNVCHRRALCCSAGALHRKRIAACCVGICDSNDDSIVTVNDGDDANTIVCERDEVDGRATTGDARASARDVSPLV